MEIDIAEVREWARAGGIIARRYFQTTIREQRKEDNTAVTQADIEIEQFLRAQITRRYPGHGIMGEEQGIGAIDREYVWVLDPLDGTDAFVSGLPVWAISIGVLRAGEPFLGVIYLPIIDECYWNVPHEHAYCNGEVIRVNSTDTFQVQDSIMVTSRAHCEYDVSFPGKARSLGSFAAHFCYVSRGSVLGALIGFPQVWDIAAGVAILQAAGGVIVTLSEQPFDIHSMMDGSKPDEPLLISTPTLSRVLLNYICVKGAS
jgi:myo-inositol-1(or 4)-monophosphatase